MHFVFRLRVAAFAAVIALCGGAVFASDPWDAAAFTSDPKELVAAAEKVSSGDAGFVVLLDEANFSFEADGKSHTTQRRMVRIVDDSAIEGLGTIEVPWAPWYNDRPTVAARG